MFTLIAQSTDSVLPSGGRFTLQLNLFWWDITHMLHHQIWRVSSEPQLTKSTNMKPTQNPTRWHSFLVRGTHGSPCRRLVHVHTRAQRGDRLCVCGWSSQKNTAQVGSSNLNLSWKGNSALSADQVQRFGETQFNGFMFKPKQQKCGHIQPCREWWFKADYIFAIDPDGFTDGSESPWPQVVNSSLDLKSCNVNRIAMTTNLQWKEGKRSEWREAN